MKEKLTQKDGYEFAIEQGYLKQSDLKDWTFDKLFREIRRSRDLNGNEKIFYTLILNFYLHDNTETYCFMSIDTFAFECGVVKQTAISTLNSLTEKGYVEKYQRYNVETQRYESNVYVPVKDALFQKKVENFKKKYIFYAVGKTDADTK